MKGLRRVDVSVRRDTDPEGSTIVTLAGFMRPDNDDIRRPPAPTGTSTAGPRITVAQDEGTDE